MPDSHGFSVLSVQARDHVAFSQCSNYSDSFSYISILHIFPLLNDYGQDGADDDVELEGGKGQGGTGGRKL